MDEMADTISRLPPELIKNSGRKATVVLLDGTEEAVYHLARRGNYEVVSKEPYTAVQRYRDIELIVSSEIKEIIFSE